MRYPSLVKISLYLSPLKYPLFDFKTTCVGVVPEWMFSPLELVIRTLAPSGLLLIATGQFDLLTILAHPAKISVNDRNSTDIDLSGYALVSRKP